MAEDQSLPCYETVAISDRYSPAPEPGAGAPTEATPAYREIRTTFAVTTQMDLRTPADIAKEAMAQWATALPSLASRLDNAHLSRAKQHWLVLLSARAPSPHSTHMQASQRAAHAATNIQQLLISVAQEAPLIDIAPPVVSENSQHRARLLEEVRAYREGTDRFFVSPTGGDVAPASRDGADCLLPIQLAPNYMGLLALERALAHHEADTDLARMRTQFERVRDDTQRVLHYADAPPALAWSSEAPSLAALREEGAQLLEFRRRLTPLVQAIFPDEGVQKMLKVVDRLEQTENLADDQRRAMCASIGEHFAEMRARLESLLADTPNSH